MADYKKLILAVANTAFDCGAFDGEGLTKEEIEFEYRILLNRSNTARAELLKAIEAKT